MAWATGRRGASAAAAPFRPTAVIAAIGPASPRALALTVVLLLGSACAAEAQTPTNEPYPISVAWVDVPIEDVLASFAEFSGKSIVVGPWVTGFVTAYIEDRPWDVALRAILSAHGLVAAEDEHGIITVTAWAMMDGEEVEPIVTRTYRLAFAKASELVTTLAPHLSERGRISVAQSTNALVISDIPSVHEMIAGLLRR